MEEADFFPLNGENARLFVSNTEKYYLDKILLFRVNTGSTTRRVKKGNSAETERVLAIIWWALNQAVVVEVKSLCLHRSYSQTPPSELFCRADGIKSISAVKRMKTSYVLPKQLLPGEGGKGEREREELIQMDISSSVCPRVHHANV